MKSDSSLSLLRPSFTVFWLKLLILISILLAGPASGQICGPCCEQPLRDGAAFAWPDQNRFVEVYISTDFDSISGGRAAIRQAFENWESNFTCSGVTFNGFGSTVVSGPGTVRVTRSDIPPGSDGASLRQEYFLLVTVPGSNAQTYRSIPTSQTQPR